MIGENRDYRENEMMVSEEILDVVDANDKVVTVKTRGEIHRRGLMHRAVHILVFNSPGQLFIQKRSMTKDENPGLWDTSAAGHLDSGESYLDCARRELGEELGIDNDVPLEYLFKLPARVDTGNEHSVVYRCCFDGPLVLQVEEIDDGRWVSSAELDRRIAAGDDSITDLLCLIWQRYKRSRARSEFE